GTDPHAARPEGHAEERGRGVTIPSEGAPVRRIHTRLCGLLGVRYPIVQTGMGWVAGPRLAAATSNAGGLGILAAATMTLDELNDAIVDMKSKTQPPFGVNLRTDAPDIEDRIDLLIDQRVKVA